MRYHKINNLSGWLCFVIASVSYILTLEPSVSFWDCGEFISCAYRLQVSHQPGYPLFAMICKAFSLLSMGDRTKVAYFTNLGCALASGATVMFLFWTITAMARKLTGGVDGQRAPGNIRLVIGSGFVGALAFAYSDTFWFSAVETIVFAQSSLCIAIVFWAILKWDAEADNPRADKWIVLIAYVIGLSIGIHLLNLLTIPAMAMVYYFRRYRATFAGGLIAFIVGVIILLFVQYGIIQYTVQLAGYFDLFAVNAMGFAFGTGAFSFVALLILLLAFGLWLSYRKKKPVLNLALLCISFIYLGYFAFAYIPIRANANTNLDNTHPDNAFTLVSYLNRDQYTPSPLLYGPYFDGKYIGEKQGSLIYRKGKTKYEVVGRKTKYLYDHNTFLPRIFSNEGDDPQFYREWLQLSEKQVPNFGDNLKFMFSWQIYQMYFRYFFWNFVGRYNQQDGQSNTSDYDGNWTSGILDGSRHLPDAVIHGNTYTPLFALPLIIGLGGMFYHYRTRKHDALIISLLWFFMGLGVILYVNQPSIQPRERDYSYVGSFYAFAIWIGLGVIPLARLLKSSLSEKRAVWVATGVCLVCAPALMAGKEWKAHDRSTKWTPHDMAYDYLVSCPKNAILLVYGDNETYSLWYDQEVENIRPDVRVVNMSLLSADWNIRQMQSKINTSEALPITMPFDKYKDGVRDIIYYQPQKLSKDTMDIRTVFDFITSDDPANKMRYQNGLLANYLPTKFFRLSVNPDEMVKSGVVSADQKTRLDTAITWKYTSNFVTKERLALIDLLAHNNWKRPICFPVTAGTEIMIGLQPYLFKEGLTYRLIPFKRDTSIKDQLRKTNTLVMYDNLMHHFKWGNFKKARYLDPESANLFYPTLNSQFLNLVQSLLKEHRPQLAASALRQYDAVLPDLYPYPEIISTKTSLAESAYQVNEIALGNQLIMSADNYLADQMRFQYFALAHHTQDLNPQLVQYSVMMMKKVVQLSSTAGQADLNNHLNQRLIIFEKQFSPLLSKIR
jgi:hypothetical protein